MSHTDLKHLEGHIRLNSKIFRVNSMISRPNFKIFRSNPKISRLNFKNPRINSMIYRVNLKISSPNFKMKGQIRIFLGWILRNLD